MRDGATRHAGPVIGGVDTVMDRSGPIREAEDRKDTAILAVIHGVVPEVLVGQVSVHRVVPEVLGDRVVVHGDAAMGRGLGVAMCGRPF